MKIIFSRHAKRRLKLYNIPQSLILTLLSNEDFLHRGKQEIVKHVPNSALPIKVVFDVQDDTITVISAYPLKKIRER